MKYYRNKQTGKNVFVSMATEITSFISDAFYNNELYQGREDYTVEFINPKQFLLPPYSTNDYAIKGDSFGLPKSAVVLLQPAVFSLLFEEREELPDYKVRMKEEIKQLEYRTNKLNALLDKEKRGELDFVLNCPVWMLEKQLKAMREYLSILYGRCAIEKVSLEKEEINEEQNED